MSINFPVLLGAAIIPLLVGFIWYNPKVLGERWMKEVGLTHEDGKGSNMAVVFGLAYVFSLMAAMALQFMVIHQFSVFSILADNPGMADAGSDVRKMYDGFMADHGRNFRTFKHGAFHGVLAGLMMALPIIGTNALFEKKSWTYVWINVGFWTICFALMGGVICQFA
ncbi:MAG: DUF1761 domain-containing protein [Saprospiraceae bacterium]|nr:DUF1761 domain-containing protein [Saprospiraceae bacterium]